MRPISHRNSRANRVEITAGGRRRRVKVTEVAETQLTKLKGWNTYLDTRYQKQNDGSACGFLGAQEETASATTLSIDPIYTEGPTGPTLFCESASAKGLSANVDFSSGGTFTCFVVCDKFDGASAALRVAVEYERYFAGTNGWSLFFTENNNRIYIGMGTAGVYSDLYYDSAILSTGAHVYAFTGDSGQAHPNQLKLWIDGVAQTPTSIGLGTGMVGNFASGPLTLGGRDNGAGGLERPFNGKIQTILTTTAVISDIDIEETSQLLAVQHIGTSL